MWNTKASTDDAHPPQPASPPRVAAPGDAEERRVVAWVGQSVRFKGELVSSEDMRIEGQVEGTIEVRDHDLILGPNAKVHADIIAKTITVRGAVTGTLTAIHRVDIRETATIDGHVTAPRLRIEDGATVHGTLRTTATNADTRSSIAGVAAVGS